MNGSNKRDAQNKQVYFPVSINRDQAKDTGMAVVLICLLIGYIGKKTGWINLSIVFLLINMIYPLFYKYTAKLWIGISNIMGAVASKILLTVIFFVVVTPIGLIRRCYKSDQMCLDKWKEDSSSVFMIRDHVFNSHEIEKPY